MAERWDLVKTKQHDNRGQMLLATGVILMMSLLSMAIFSVKIAGLSMPYDSSQGEVLLTTIQIETSLPELVEYRAKEWYDAVMSEHESVETSMVSLQDDILHHGEIRGVELKMLNITVVEQAGLILVSCELGAADDDSMMLKEIQFSVDLD